MNTDPLLTPSLGSARAPTRERLARELPDATLARYRERLDTAPLLGYLERYTRASDGVERTRFCMAQRSVELAPDATVEPIYTPQQMAQLYVFFARVREASDHAARFIRGIQRAFVDGFREVEPEEAEAAIGATKKRAG